MAKVKAYFDNKTKTLEAVDSLIKRFSKKVKAEGLLETIRKKEYYKSKSIIKKEKIKKSQKLKNKTKAK